MLMFCNVYATSFLVLSLLLNFHTLVVYFMVELTTVLYGFLYAVLNIILSVCL
jgi:hypothetical protein